MSDERFDVAILGSGLGGTMLASILARHGQRVLILEKESHPRFAIGEALLPQSTMWMWILAQRYDVPEIGYLSDVQKIHDHVSPTCGMKRTIGFLYHEEGKRQDPEKSNLLVPPATPLTAESHLFRQDVDLFMLDVARKYGAVYRDHVDVRGIELGDDGVELTTDGGETFRARYLVDGSGFRSPVAQKLGLRETPTPLETQSRSIFTHVKGMALYDDTLEAGESPGLSARWSDGTIHHVFPGGWFWIIPFNNIAGSTNPLCSVGVTLNMKMHPPTGQPPEEEMRDIIARYPSIARHFEGAEPVRPFIGTGRLQYSSTTGSVPRCFLLAHAHGFVDALYSRGLISTFETIHALVGPLLQALADDDFAAERFAYPERLQNALLRANDRMVSNSYRAFPSYPVWDAWLRIWLLNKIYGDLRLFSVCLEYLETHDPARFATLERDPLPGASRRGGDPIQDLFDDAEVLLARYEAGTIGADEVAAKILASLDGHPSMPPVRDWSEPASRHLDFLPEKLQAMLGWGFTEAPQALRDRMFRFNPAVLGPPPGAVQETGMAAAPGGS